MTEKRDGWQVGKSLAECICHMLDAGTLSDVTFHVGFPGGEKQTISAHRFVLASRSPVFEAMFCGDLAVKPGDTVTIEDVEPAVFKDMLSYLYSDEVNLSAKNGLHMLYAAQKYIVPSLETKCSVYLRDNITNDSVCTILTHAVEFQNKELEESCAEYIQENTLQVFEADDFVKLSQDALCLILQKDALHLSNEMEVAKACLRWANAKMQKEGLTPVPSNVRDTLGRALFLIRFPSADLKEFTQVFGSSGVLTDAEKVQLYQYLVTKEGACDGLVAGFSTSPRFSPQHQSISRFSFATGWWNCDGKTDAICVKVDKPVLLLGLAVYGTEDATPINHLKVKIFNDTTAKCLLSMEENGLQCTGESKPVVVMWPKPILLSPWVTYDVCVNLKCRRTFHGIGGKDEVSEHGRKFMFSDSARSKSDTDLSQGQIPELIFRKT